MTDKNEYILEPDVKVEPLWNKTPSPQQTQTIRIHLHEDKIHLHANENMVVMPIAEWYLVQRKLRSMEPFTFVDPQNKCVAYLKPSIIDRLFEVTVELVPIQIGTRFDSLNNASIRLPRYVCNNKGKNNVATN